mgnify:CR=1 FL=1
MGVYAPGLRAMAGLHSLDERTRLAHPRDAFVEVSAQGFLLAAHSLAHQALQVGFSGQNRINAALQPLPFWQVQLERTEAISEAKSIDDRSRVITECIRLYDVHSPRGEDPGNLGE